PGSAFNCYWKMPFRKKARITLENINNAEEMRLYYQINYTLMEVPEDEGYFHAQFRRSNPTQGSIHTLVDGIKGKGYKAAISRAHPKHCEVTLLESWK
ncbi:DUF2961 domain-containing protein, partial [Parabacteroides distasonis]|uniref:DUF2961 domain-containing protein n=1 Tax=Parabacteroides distasonis TaxID=823 RepID=UPI00210D1722